VGGATGKLGSRVCEFITSSKDIELTGATVSPNSRHLGRELFPGVFASSPSDLPRLLENADVYVDLTTPDAASRTVGNIPKYGVSLILGTTAVSADALECMKDNVSKNGTSAIISSNFAECVNVFWKTAEYLAKVLKGYEIEISEIHHTQKKDLPSGTAIETLRRVQNASGITETVYDDAEMGIGNKIRVRSMRADGVVGDHTVTFTGDTDVLEIRHKAVSRDAFAIGCIDSIRWIFGKKDGKVHSMDEVFE
jgi:dihydrodipicolinate reductase